MKKKIKTKAPEIDYDDAVLPSEADMTVVDAMVGDKKTGLIDWDSFEENLKKNRNELTKSK